MKVKLTLVLLAFLIANLSSIAQNEVPNPGFEQNLGLPNNLGQWNLVNSWDNAGSAISTPDYFHYLGSLGGDLPTTPVAEIDAHGGQAVMGFAATGRSGTNYREYIHVKFSTPLVIGNKYRVAFFISNGTVTSLSNTGLGTSDFGFRLSVAQPNQTDNDPLNIQPTAKMSTVLYNREWVEIAFNVIATDNHEHLTIGVFGDDSQINIETREGDDPDFAYYFVDDFSVEVVDNSISGYDDHGRPIVTENVIGPMQRPRNPSKGTLYDDYEDFFIPNAFSPDDDGVNDVFKPESVDPIDYKLCVFSRWGDLVFESSSHILGWDGKARGKNVENGIYIWRIEYLDEDVVGHDKTRQLEGSVHLIR